MSIRTAMRRYASHVASAFGRAPLECAITVALAVLFSAAIHADAADEETIHFAVAAIIVLGFAWSATLLFASQKIEARTRWILNAIGGAAGAIYLVTTHDISSGSEAWRAWMLVMASISGVLAAPALLTPREDRSLRMRRVNGRIILRTVGIYLYGLALFAGLAIALGAIDNLFDLHIKSDIYGHVFIWIMVVLVPWVIIGGLDDYVRPLDELSEVNRVVYRLAGYLIPPLVAIYLLILYAYVIRIGVTRELPHNLVSPMVIAAGMLSALALVVFDPDPAALAGLRWLRWTPVAFLPLAPLALFALHARTDAYGWTEFRIVRVVIVLVLAALAVGACVRLFGKRRPELRVIPVAVGIAMLLMAVGPWGAGPIARRNQQHRLAAAFAELHIDPVSPPKDTTTRKITRAQMQKLDGAADYLRQNFGAAALERIAPAAAKANTGVVAYYHLTAPASPAEPPSSLTFATLPENERMVTPNGDIYRVNASTPYNRKAQIAWISTDSAFFVVTGDTTFAVIPVAALQPAPSFAREHEISSTGAALPVKALRSGEDRGYLTLLDLEMQNKNGRTVVSHVSGILTMKRRQP